MDVLDHLRVGGTTKAPRDVNLSDIKVAVVLVIGFLQEHCVNKFVYTDNTEKK